MAEKQFSFTNFFCHEFLQILVYFLCKNCNPLKKVTPSFISKNWDPVKIILFENFVGGWNHCKKRYIYFYIYRGLFKSGGLTSIYWRSKLNLKLSFEAQSFKLKKSYAWREWHISSFFTCKSNHWWKKFIQKEKFLDFNFVTTFYIRKIKDEHRIMSQVTNKEAGFSSRQNFQLLQCLMSHRFHCIKA